MEEEDEDENEQQGEETQRGLSGDAQLLSFESEQMAIADASKLLDHLVDGIMVLHSLTSFFFSRTPKKRFGNHVW